jgi:hypothetical protein
VRQKDGTEEFDVMSTEEIETVRRRSPAADDGPWVTDWREMAKKTVFRRLSKILTLSPELVELLEHDDEPLTERERFNAAKPVAASVAEAPMAPKRGRPVKEPTMPHAPESVLEAVRELLIEQKFIDTDLLELLRQLKRIKDEKLLSEVSDETLNLVLEDWEKCLKRLEQIRARRLQLIEQSSDSLFGVQQMPLESVAVPEQPLDAAKEENAPETVLARVQILLSQHGFVDAHLLELLRRVKLIKDQKTLQEVDDEALRLVLEDWENCEKRLEQIKAGK